MTSNITILTFLPIALRHENYISILLLGVCLIMLIVFNYIIDVKYSPSLYVINLY